MLFFMEYVRSERFKEFQEREEPWNGMMGIGREACTILEDLTRDRSTSDVFLTVESVYSEGTLFGTATVVSGDYSQRSSRRL